MELVLLDFGLTAITLNHIIEHYDPKWSGICVPPFWVKKMRRDIDDQYSISAAIGYPAGYQMTEDKLVQMQGALKQGANEIACSLNLSAFKSGMPWVKIELAKCAQAAHAQEALFNVFLNGRYLANSELEAIIPLCRDSGVDNLIWETHDPDVVPSKRQRAQITSAMGLKIYGPFASVDPMQTLYLEDVNTIGITNHPETP